jgi:hypothetical protein
MNNINLTNKITTYCIIFLCTLGAHAATSEQIKAENPEPKIPEIVKLQQRARAIAKEHRAEKAYNKRNAEITPRAEDTAPPNLDNAALLYYQAFLLRPEPNLAITRKLEGVLTGAESDRQVRTYLGHCLPMIKITETASRMPQCHWGTWHEPGVIFNKIGWTNEIRSLTRIQLADAGTLAADGQYRAALERCLTVRRFARHLGEDLSENPKLYFHSLNTDKRALGTVRHVLGMIPPDEDILTWFRGRLSAVQGAPMLFAKELKTRIVEVELNNIRTNPAYLAWLKDMLVKLTENEKAKENIRSLTDEQFLLRTSEVYQSLLDSILRIADSEMTYEQKRTEMQKLFSKLMEADDNDPLFKGLLTLKNTETVIDFRHQFHLEHQAHINAVKAAVELYLVVAKTGRLPETLPSGLPKDPSTNEDFIYEITDDGFILRCGIKNLRSRKFEQYEFKVKSEN